MAVETVLYNKLINSIKQYNTNADFGLIDRAYNLAHESHKNQKRKSGEPYIIHPLSVSIILAEYHMDDETIAAGLLHDVVEDTSITNKDITYIFGRNIAFLVDGVTKLENLSHIDEKDEIKAQNFRKLFIAMYNDVRIILIKLADRLHNLRTLQFQPAHKQIEIAQETLDIYAPIARRLGINRIKSELEDLSLKYLKSNIYEHIESNLSKIIADKSDFIKENIEKIHNIFSNYNIEISIEERTKNKFSIYKKMIKRKEQVEQLYDSFYIKIIVKKMLDCYLALGVLHNNYRPVLERFKDYISIPKINKYQAIHTTLISSTGEMFEVQISTKEMDDIAEMGIIYKLCYNQDGEDNSDDDNASNINHIRLLKDIFDWQQEVYNNKEFLYKVKRDLDPLLKHIYCFTPKSEIKYFPKGSSVIDFAYSVHSDIGNKMVKAYVNNRPVPLSYVLKNGDCVSIVTSSNAPGPQLDWLMMSKTPRAKECINKWLKANAEAEDMTPSKLKQIVNNGSDGFEPYNPMKYRSDNDDSKRIVANISIVVNDEIGVLSEVSNLLYRLDINIININAANETDQNNKAIINVSFYVKTEMEINYLIEMLSAIENVVHVDKL